MKTTFDLPDPLLRQAKGVAAQQDRPLRDLVAEAIGEKLEQTAGSAAGETQSGGGRREAWERWRARLVQLPDGGWLNPDGIEDESFFQSLDEVRGESWVSRDPFGSRV